MTDRGGAMGAKNGLVTRRRAQRSGAGLNERKEYAQRVTARPLR
jgi:hypothetical protein